MAGRNPAEAVENYRGPLQRALSCAILAVLNVRGGYQPGREHGLTLGDGGVQPLRGVNLSFSIAQRYRIVEDPTPGQGPWRVQTTSYSYSLETRDEQEVLRYDWHPFAEGEISFPHVHLGAGARVGLPELRVAHLPTGRISVEQFVDLLLTDFGAEALKDDWRTILAQTSQGFSDWGS